MVFSSIKSFFKMIFLPIQDDDDQEASIKAEKYRGMFLIVFGLLSFGFLSIVWWDIGSERNNCLSHCNLTNILDIEEFRKMTAEVKQIEQDERYLSTMNSYYNSSDITLQINAVLSLLSAKANEINLNLEEQKENAKFCVPLIQNHYIPLLRRTLAVSFGFLIFILAISTRIFYLLLTDNHGFKGHLSIYIICFLITVSMMSYIYLSELDFFQNITIETIVNL